MKNKSLIISCALCVLCIAIMTAALIYSCGREPNQAEFIPPPFDISAQRGAPDVPEELAWSQLSRDGMGYAVHLCGRPVVEAGELVVYFTNPTDNAVWLKLRIQDAEGKTIGESGLIKPGEYIRSVKLDILPASGDDIKLKVMAYEPETYYSVGSVSLNPVLTTK